MKASNLISMVTLIIRLSVKYGPLNTDSIKTLDEDWKRICHGFTGSWDDRAYIADCWKKFPLVMRHWEEIFSDPLEETYPGSEYKMSFHSGGGIVSLCTFQTHIAGVDKRFKKICEANNVK